MLQKQLFVIPTYRLLKIFRDFCHFLSILLTTSAKVDSQSMISLDVSLTGQHMDSVGLQEFQYSTCGWASKSCTSLGLR